VPDTPFRSGYVAIVGPANSGKSTLLNRLLDLHFSAVAPRPQTTRHRILGIRNGPGYQALFLDTPGLLDPRYALQRLMKFEIASAVGDADVVLLVIDACRPPDDPLVLLGQGAGKRLLVALNKVDAVKEKERLLPLAVQFGTADAVLMVSALKGSGLETLVDRIVAALPEHPAYYPTDQVSERPERFFAAEFVREAVFNLYGEEVPYATAVTVEEFKERPGRKDYIRAVVFVERDSQKAILIGKGGAALKRVGSRARRALENFLGRPVYLELNVKVAADWRENEGFIRENVYGR
jgi:GTP-binding protein Era